MKTVHVTASREYDIVIGPGLLATIGQRIAALGGVSKVCIVSDSNVWPLYGDAAERSLLDTGLHATAFVFPAGEEQKNGTTYLQLLNHLAEAALTRNDLIVALGGGVVGDLAGFAAATFLRGIRFVQVPTTLLAAVDSSVGGKTAIDLPSGKNLAGAFCQPSLVLCDTLCLDTLDPEVFLDGCGEVIKYGVLYDAAFLAMLGSCGPELDREEVIARCDMLKRDVVQEDEFDTGARMKLNLGHTIGHGVESCSGYAISHGRAVAIGMAIVARAACRRGYCSPATRDTILDTLERFGLLTRCDFTAEVLCEAALRDKKRSGTSVKLIIPAEPGRCIIEPIAITELPSFIEAGL